MNIDFSLGKGVKDETYFYSLIKSIHDVVWKAGKQVDNEPTSQVVHPNYFGIRDHFSSWTHECCVKVKNYVNKKDYVDDAVEEREGFCSMICFMNLKSTDLSSTRRLTSSAVLLRKATLKGTIMAV